MENYTMVFKVSVRKHHATCLFVVYISLAKASHKASLNKKRNPAMCAEEKLMITINGYNIVNQYSTLFLDTCFFPNFA